MSTSMSLFIMVPNDDTKSKKIMGKPCEDRPALVCIKHRHKVHVFVSYGSSLEDLRNKAVILASPRD